MQTLFALLNRVKHREFETQPDPSPGSTQIGAALQPSVMDLHTLQHPQGLHFPPELDDHLMYIISNDPDLLRTCALVCRAWLAASRVYLFHDVTIENEAMFLRFEDVVINSPMIRDCVRILRIDRQNRKYELTFPWVNNNLSPTLPRQLTRLHTFELNSVDEKWKHHSFKNLSLFTTVTRLSIIRCGLSTEELFGVISAFPSIKDLEISFIIELFNKRDSAVPLIHKPQHVEKLTLNCDDIPVVSRDGDNLIAFLMKGGCKYSLRVLDIAVSQQNVREVGRLIQELGDNLEELQIKFIRRFGSYESSLPELLDHINFSENKRLKRLTLSDPAHLATRTLLARVTSPHIHTIAFAFRLYDLRNVSNAKPELLLQTLIAPNFLHLAEVQFRYWDQEKMDGVEDAYEKAYAQLRQRNLLRVIRDPSIA